MIVTKVDCDSDGTSDLTDPFPPRLPCQPGVGTPYHD